MKTLSLLLLPLALACTPAHSETLAQYVFNGAAFGPTTEAANIEGADFTWGAGLASSYRGFGAGNTHLYARSLIVDQTVSASSDDYIEFKIDAASGFAANLTAVSFSYGFSHNSEPTSSVGTFSLRSNIDGYASNIASFDRNSVSGAGDLVQTGSIGMTATAYQNLSTITFRLYLADDGVSNTNHTLRVDDFTVEGTTISAVPEPSTYAALTGLAALGLVALRRRRS